MTAQAHRLVSIPMRRASRLRSSITLKAGKRGRLHSAMLMNSAEQISFRARWPHQRPLNPPAASALIATVPAPVRPNRVNAFLEP